MIGSVQLDVDPRVADVLGDMKDVLAPETAYCLMTASDIWRTKASDVPSAWSFVMACHMLGRHTIAGRETIANAEKSALEHWRDSTRKTSRRSLADVLRGRFPTSPETRLLEEAVERAVAIARGEGRQQASVSDLLLGFLYEPDGFLRNWLCGDNWSNGGTPLAPYSMIPDFWALEIIERARSDHKAMKARLVAGGVPTVSQILERAAAKKREEGGKDDAPQEETPWQPDPDRIWEELSRDYPWMEEANLFLAREAASVRAGRSRRIPPLLLHGERGIGKTHWCHRASGLLGCHFEAVTLGGGSTGISVSGNESVWSKSRESLPARILRDAKGRPPMVFIDEIHRFTDTAYGGSVPDALLPLLEADTASTYHDIHSGRHVDASRISWVMAANSLAPFGAPFLDRVVAIGIRRPQDTEISGALRGIRHSVLGDADGEHLEADLSAMTEAFRKDRSLRAARAALAMRSGERLWSPPRRERGLSVVHGGA